MLVDAVPPPMRVRKRIQKRSGNNKSDHTHHTGEALLSSPPRDISRATTGVTASALSQVGVTRHAHADAASAAVPLRIARDTRTAHAPRSTRSTPQTSAKQHAHARTPLTTHQTPPQRTHGNAAVAPRPAQTPATTTHTTPRTTPHTGPRASHAGQRAPPQPSQPTVTWQQHPTGAVPVSQAGGGFAMATAGVSPHSLTAAVGGPAVVMTSQASRLGTPQPQPTAHTNATHAQVGSVCWAAC